MTTRDPAATPDPAPAATQVADPPAAPVVPPVPVEPAAPAAPKPAETPPLDGEALQAELKKARAEAAKYRTERNEERTKTTALDARVKAIAKAVGLENDDGDDPEALKSTVEGLQDELKAEKVKNEFVRRATSLGADADLAWHVLNGQGKLKDLDPAADDFGSQVESVITEAVKDNPKLKAGAPPAGSADQGPQGDDPNQLSESDLEGMTPEQIVEAHEKGQLTTALSGK